MGVTLSELTRALFSTVLWEFQTTRYRGSFWFFRYGPWNKKVLFFNSWLISVMSRPGLGRPDIVVTLSDTLVINQFKRYKLEILKQFYYRFQNCFNKFWTKSPNWFSNKMISHEAGFRLIFIHFWTLLRKQLIFPNYDCSTWNNFKIPRRIIFIFIWVFYDV